MDHYNHQAFGQCDADAPSFWSVAAVGTEAPEFTISDLEGRKISLADFRGKKHVVLEFGSIT